MQFLDSPNEWEELLKSMVKFCETLPEALHDIVKQQGKLILENHELRARVQRLEESLLHLAGKEHLVSREGGRVQHH